LLQAQKKKRYGKLQIELNRLGEWVVENVMVINPVKSKAVCFTRVRVTEPHFSSWDIVFPEASSYKYLGIILHSDLTWADQVNYTLEKALHFTMHIFRKGKSSTRSVAYISLVRLILEYGAACWDP
jgi:hypothetical protein